jgi:hypothetical protein
MLKTGGEIRGVRLWIGWRREELAAIAGVHKETVAMWERRPSIPDPMPPGVAKIVAALPREAIEQWREFIRPIDVRAEYHALLEREKAAKKRRWRGSD